MTIAELKMIIEDLKASIALAVDGFIVSYGNYCFEFHVSNLLIYGVH